MDAYKGKDFEALLVGYSRKARGYESAGARFLGRGLVMKRVDVEQTLSVGRLPLVKSLGFY